MRTRLGTALFLMIMAVAVAVLVSTAASGQTALHFVVGPDTGLSVAFDDRDGDGLRLGDRISGRGPLMDETQTERVGTSYMDCVVHRRIIDPDRGLWNCNYVLELEEGDIILQGLDPRGPGEYQMAVLGGTGAYMGVRGEAAFTDVGTDGGGYTDMVLSLTP